MNVHMPLNKEPETMHRQTHVYVCVYAFASFALFPYIGTRIVSATPGQIEPGNNVSEGVLQTSQIYRREASPSDAFKCHAWN